MWNALGFLIAILPVVGVLFFIRKLFKTLRAPAINYAFGRKDIEVISLFISNKKYEQAETMLSNFNSDDLTQAIDHLAVTLSEKQLKNYSENSNKNALSSLVLGAWYLHNAWKVRTNKVASELSTKQFESYVENLRSSGPLLQAASSESWLASEAHSRLIRVNMGLGYLDEVEAHYRVSIKENPKHLWTYIHYAEAIQPKWGGSIEQVQQFLNSLPDDYLIRTTLRLKLVYDSCLSGDNYNYFNLSDDPEEVNKFVLEVASAIDAELNANPPESIQRFVMYGYMYLLTQFIDKTTQKKYKKLIGNNYSLYPFGIL
jgi:hypothetical protein